jgi:hypothetical protein
MGYAKTLLQHTTPIIAINKTLFQPTSPHIAKWAIVATIMKTVAIPFPQLRL